MKYEVKNYVIYKYEVFLTYFDEFGNEAKIIPVNQRDVSNVVFNGDENIWSRNLILEIAITNPSALKYEVKNSFKRLYIYIYIYIPFYKFFRPIFHISQSRKSLISATLITKRLKITNYGIAENNIGTI